MRSEPIESSGLSLTEMLAVTTSPAAATATLVPVAAVDSVAGSARPIISESAPPSAVTAAFNAVTWLIAATYAAVAAWVTLPKSAPVSEAVVAESRAAVVIESRPPPLVKTSAPLPHRIWRTHWRTLSRPLSYRRLWFYTSPGYPRTMGPTPSAVISIPG